MAFHNVPPNGFPDIPDIEDLEAVQGEVNQLKSGLTNVDNATALNTQDLTTPSRSKNIWAISIDKLKIDNNSGTWNGNTYTVSGVSYVCTVDNGYVNAIENSGNTSGYPSLNVYIGKLKAGSYKISMEDRFRLYEDGVQIYDSYGPADYAFTANGTSTYNVTLYRGTGEIPSNTYHPMVRLATITDPTFAPYIPSVESRIEKLEKGDVYKINASGSVEISIDSGVYMYTTGRDAARFLTVGYIGYAWDGTPVVKTIISETNTFITVTAGTGNKVTFANSSTNSSATLVVRKII